MISANLSEQKENLINIECKNEEIFDAILNWIYCGEIKFPESIFDVFDLMVLSDEYFLEDLKR